MRFRLFAAAFGLIVSAAVLQAGGWGVITVSEVPSYVTANEPVVLTFAVRSHGRSLADGLIPTLEAFRGTSVVTGTATADRQNGFYRVQFMLPTAGTWNVEINGSWKGYATARMVMVAIERGQDGPVLSAAVRGQQLFAAKGCATCHVAEMASARQFEAKGVGPSLAGKRYEAEWLRRQLANPPAPGVWSMPNLLLSSEEITALMAYINEGHSEQSARR